MRTGEREWVQVAKYDDSATSSCEQHRIIAKVDELMRLCDQLETQLSTMQNEKQSLLEAVLNDALDSGDGAPSLKRLLVEGVI